MRRRYGMLAWAALALILLALAAHSSTPSASNGALVVRANVYVVTVGLGRVAALAEDYVSHTYEVNLSRGLGLKLLVTLHFIRYGGIGEIKALLKRDSTVTAKLPSFIKEYVRSVHPSWVVRKVELVRADRFEHDLWTLLTCEGVVPKDSDYVLLLMYVPPPKGVLRTYFIRKYVPDLGAYRGFTGMVSFGGNDPLYFIDLSAIPASWPNPSQPGSRFGVHMNFTADPPLWDVSSEVKAAELVSHYIGGYVGFLVVRALMKDRLWWVPRMVLNVTVVNFGTNSSQEFRSLMRMLTPLRLEGMLHSLNPYVTWGVKVNVVNGNDTPFRQLLANASRLGNVLALNPDFAGNIVRWGLVPKLRCVNWSYCVIPAYIFVGNVPMEFHGWGMNFTGYAYSRVAILLTFPGYAGRIYELGIDDALAHEMGHMLGLTHPFDRIVRVDDTYPPGKGGYARWWFFDFVTTPMSYAPTLTGWGGGPFYYDAKSLGRYYAAQLIRAGLKYGAPATAVAEAEALLSEDKVLGAGGAVAVMESALSRLGLTRTVTLTATAAGATVTSSVTVLKTSTVTTTSTTTSLKTLTRSTTTTMTKTVTSTSTSTVTSLKTVTRTVTVVKEVESPYLIAALAGVVAFATALIVAAATSRARRGGGQ